MGLPTSPQNDPNYTTPVGHLRSPQSHGSSRAMGRVAVPVLRRGAHGPDRLGTPGVPRRTQRLFVTHRGVTKKATALQTSIAHPYTRGPPQAERGGWLIDTQTKLEYLAQGPW